MDFITSSTELKVHLTIFFFNFQGGVSEIPTLSVRAGTSPGQLSIFHRKTPAALPLAGRSWAVMFLGMKTTTLGLRHSWQRPRPSLWPGSSLASSAFSSATPGSGARGLGLSKFHRCTQQWAPTDPTFHPPSSQMRFRQGKRCIANCTAAHQLSSASTGIFQT